MTLHERSVRRAPGGRPQPLAVHGGSLWVGCWDTSRLYAITRATWAVEREVALPGLPYGLASLDGALYAVVSVGEDDDRHLFRIDGDTVDAAAGVALPESSGSHLTSDGSRLYLVQQGLRRMLEIARDGTLVREFPLPTRCGGVAFRDGVLHLLAADADFDVVEFATLDLTDATAEPTILARVDVESRGLAFDGTSWWTCRRELGEIVDFDA